MESMAAKENKQLHDMTLVEMDDLWNRIKAWTRKRINNTAVAKYHDIRTVSL